VSGEPIIGIDLGTTHSLVAICDAAGPRVLADGQGRLLLPSVVRLLPGAEPVVGHQAKARAVEFPLQTIASSKRFMGRSHSESLRLAEGFGGQLVPGPRGMAAFQVEGRTVTPQEVAAMVLAELRRTAEAALGHPVHRAVITVPAYFDDAQRQATRDAARLAGLLAERIVNEPTAAALAYGLNRARKPETIAVYDLGGGTFDISVLRIEPDEADQSRAAEVFQVLSTNGDTRLGGDDIDLRIMEWLLEQARVALGALQLLPPVRQRFRAFAEQAKIALSDRESVTLEVDLGTGQTLRCTLTRAQLESMARPLVDRTLERFRAAMADAGQPTLDRVVMVGGSTRMPLVRAAVRNLTGLEPYTALDPDQVVALGAAVQAHILMGGRRDLLLDVIPLSLGMETRGGAVAKLIMRNTAVPTRATETFTTSADDQTGIVIHVVQGEREMVADCRSIGRFELRGLPPMPAGIPQLQVEFAVDANGVLTVSAAERRSGKQASLQVVPSHGLTAEEVDRLEREAFAHARQDMHRHRVVDLAVNARLDLKWIGEALLRVSEALEPAYREELEAAMTRLQGMCEAAERQPAATDADAFHRAKETLDRLSMRLHEVSIARSLRSMDAPTSGADRAGS
jgi:molecular chaperone DnaK (HSP70)